MNVAGGDISGGDNNANQTATNGALSAAGNLANTDQSNNQTQSAGSSCLIGCGGAGQAQLSEQKSLTAQLAASKADANQNAVNANVPVNIAGGDVHGGDNSANQTATNGALSAAGNAADTHQSNNQTQSAGSSCLIGCGGAGQAQLSSQGAATLQGALSSADAKQNAVNANVPVNIAGGDIYGGSNSANQTATNGAASLAGNLANTDQSNNQSQSASSSCLIGCGGAGQAQLSGQAALTLQGALSSASANQNAVNANVPVNIAGGSIFGGSNSANQTATNGAGSLAGNFAGTGQTGGQSQS